MHQSQIEVKNCSSSICELYKDSLPESATHWLVVTAGFFSFLFATTFVLISQPFSNLVHSALFIFGVTAGVILIIDLTWQKVYLRPSTGLDFTHDDPSWNRTLHKFAGLLGSLVFIGFLYWLFPEYHGSFYDPYYDLLKILLPPWLVLAIPYLYFVDRKMVQPYDGYWQLGKFLTLQIGAVDWKKLKQHLLGWLIKGYFLPLMFVYLCQDLNRFLSFDFTRQSSANFQQIYDFLYPFLFLIDVNFATLGYLMSLRLADTHLRSAESTLLGWVVALACYEPFWSLVSHQYLAYETSYRWGAWLWGTPLLYELWGSAILLLLAVYVWATIMFGIRFSNLTHRGIITNGPYRWTKHPAYLAKNLSWWMISIPWLAQGGHAEALHHCLLLLLLNLVYYFRAKTEERHLAKDPTYIIYIRWIECHGIFSVIVKSMVRTVWEPTIKRLAPAGRS